LPQLLQTAARFLGQLMLLMVVIPKAQLSKTKATLWSRCVEADEQSTSRAVPCLAPQVDVGGEVFPRSRERPPCRPSAPRSVRRTHPHEGAAGSCLSPRAAARQPHWVCVTASLPLGGSWGWPSHHLFGAGGAWESRCHQRGRRCRPQRRWTV